MADFADYRPYLPTAEQSRIVGDDAISHAKGRLAIPRIENLFNQWGELAKQEFRGITVDGERTSGLYSLRDEGAPVDDMVASAGRLLESLSADERKRGLQEVDSNLWRQWQNTEIFVEKHGLRLEFLSDETRELVLRLLRSSLSDQGYQNTVGVMQLNAFLGNAIGAPGVLGEWSYNFCIYGKPSNVNPWGWQLWGHHLGLNCLVIGGQMVLTPSFQGAEICFADEGRFKGLQMFQDEHRRGLDLFNSLSAQNQQKARLGFDLGGSDLPEGRVHFADYLMLGGAHQDNRVVPLEGLNAAKMTGSQCKCLLDLVNAYVGAMPDGPRQAKMADVERHLNHTHFCWIGGNGPTTPFYYRIQSPVIFIEFDHHAGVFLTNKEPLGFHVHTVVRSPNGNDYGLDVLRQHYAHSHKNAHNHVNHA